jgi:hypothetical protein
MFNSWPCRVLYLEITRVCHARILKGKSTWSRRVVLSACTPHTSFSLFFYISPSSIHPSHVKQNAMADLPTLLLASLAPDTRKQAEQALSSLADQPGFVEAVLRLVLDQNGDKGARLAGSVYLKNVVKRKWDDVRWYLLCFRSHTFDMITRV